MIKPENYDEIEAVIALIWDDEYTDNMPKGKLREVAEARIVEMRDGQSADDVRGRG